ncbi:MAG: tetratricopeptide repeat protein [Bacteroidota bacterium]
MFKYFKIFFFLVALTIFLDKSFAQELQAPGHEQDYANALFFFEKEQFNEALPYFFSLLEKYSKDPYYQYYTGICFVRLNLNLSWAVDLLQKASFKDVPSDVYFFLARAYHLNFQFNEAIEYYQKFKLYGKKRDIQEYDPDLFIEQCRTGKDLSLEQAKLKVVSRIIVSKNNTDSVLNLLFNGEFIRIPTELEPTDLNHAQFIVNYFPADGKKAYFSAYYPGNDQQFDVFEVQKKQGEWSTPQNLGLIINSMYDEKYPFLDSSSNTLYFCHDGPGSMGGYDIFRSIYNTVTGSWNEPENIGFPVNSTANDFLFITRNDSLFFFSDRFIHRDSAYFYTALMLHEKETSVLPDQQLVDIAKLPVTGQPVLEMDFEKVVEKNNERKIKSYEENIDKALKYQVKTDSLVRLSWEKRLHVRVLAAGKERNILFRDIKELDHEAEKYQTMADIHFQHAREIELNEMIKEVNGFQSNIEELALKDKEIKDGVDPGNDKGEGKEKNPGIKDLIDVFIIQDESPYSDEKPFPLDVNIEEGLIYKIQLGAFSQPIHWDKFGGIFPITGEVIADRGITKYYAGLFTTSTATMNALKKVREYGYKDAYIVSYFNGKKVSLGRAHDLEKTF